MPSDLNPYDFRCPLREPAHFAGRTRQLEAIEREMSHLAESRPAHFFITGPPRIGKTSLLRRIAESAKSANILAVHVPINPGAVAATGDLFRNAALSTLQALRDKQQQAASALWDRWQLCGRLAPGGEVGPATPASTIWTEPFSFLATQPDLSELEKAARESGYEGVVLLIDGLEHIKVDEDLESALAHFLDASTYWMVVASGDEDAEVFLLNSAHKLRHRLQIMRIGGFETEPEVSQALRLPLSPSERLKVSIAPGTVGDLLVLTRGHPWLVKVFGYFMWNSRSTPDGEELSLSTEIIDAALAEQRSMRADIGWWFDQVDEEIDRIHDLSDEDVLLAAPLIGFEDFSEDEFGLMMQLSMRSDVRSAFAGSDVPKNEPEESERFRELMPALFEHLEEAQVILREEDRFRVAGSEFARMYLRYEARDRKGDAVIPSRTGANYPSSVTMMHLWVALEAAGLNPRDPVLAGALWTFDPGRASAAAERVNTVVDAARTGTAESLLKAGLRQQSYDVGYPGVPDPQLLVLVVEATVAADDDLALEMARKVIAEVRWAPISTDVAELNSRLASWTEKNKDRLAAYRLGGVSFEAVGVPSEKGAATAAALSPGSLPEISFALWDGGHIRDGASFLEQAVVGLDWAAAHGAQIDFEIADALVRLSFFRLALRDDRGAEESLDRACEAPHVNDFLTLHNLAFVRALRREFAAAASRENDAIDRAIVSASRALLMLYLPIGDDIRPADPRWPVSWIVDSSAVKVLRAQRLVYEALSGAYSPEEFRAASAELSGTVATARLLSWTWATHFRDTETAVAVRLLTGDEAAGDVDLEQELALLRGKPPQEPKSPVSLAD